MEISAKNKLLKPSRVSKSPNLRLPPLDLERKTKPKIMAAIPVYNEERFIGSVVLKTKKYVDEVVVIDDGSTDATSEIAKAAGATVIKHEHNEGKGAAINTAFNMARKLRIKALVLLDGDGQHNPAEITAILKSLFEKKADVIIGSRFLDIKSDIPKYRTLGQRILTFTTNLCSHTKITDSQSGFRAFSKKAIKAMDFTENGLSVESEMQFLINEKNLKVAEIPIYVGYKDKAKRGPVSHGLGVLNRILRHVGEQRPLLFFGVSGMIMFLGGIAVGMVALNIFVKTGGFSTGYTLLSVLLCILGALVAFMGIMLNSTKNFLSDLRTSLTRSLEKRDKEE